MHDRVEKCKESGDEVQDPQLIERQRVQAPNASLARNQHRAFTIETVGAARVCFGKLRLECLRRMEERTLGPVVVLAALVWHARKPLGLVAVTSSDPVLAGKASEHGTHT